MFGTLSLVPALAFAQVGNASPANGLVSFLIWLQGIMNMVVPILIGLAVIVSIWGLVRILTNTFRVDNNAPTGQYPVVQYPPRVP